MISADELVDDGEYEEILEDMRDEGSKFGMRYFIFLSCLFMRLTLFF